MFDTPLTTNISAGDPDLPGLLNSTRDRLNQTRAEADYIPRRNIEDLVSPQWNTTGFGIAEVLKFGPILGFRFILNATQDIPSAQSHRILSGLPPSFLPQMASGVLGLGRVGGKTVAIRRDEAHFAVFNLDGSPVSFAAGEELRIIFTSWSHFQASTDSLPGTAAV